MSVENYSVFDYYDLFSWQGLFHFFKDKALITYVSGPFIVLIMVRFLYNDWEILSAEETTWVDRNNFPRVETTIMKVLAIGFHSFFVLPEFVVYSTAQVFVGYYLTRSILELMEDSKDWPIVSWLIGTMLTPL